jgi:hypothetical protein
MLNRLLNFICFDELLSQKTAESALLYLCFASISFAFETFEMKMKSTQKKIKKGNICRFLTQKLIKANEIEKSTQHVVHGAS